MSGVGVSIGTDSSVYEITGRTSSAGAGVLTCPLQAEIRMTSKKTAMNRFDMVYFPPEWVAPFENRYDYGTGDLSH
jgi:hypothetical protein